MDLFAYDNYHNTYLIQSLTLVYTWINPTALGGNESLNLISRDNDLGT